LARHPLLANLGTDPTNHESNRLVDHVDLIGPGGYRIVADAITTSAADR
jgi:hypothetical protein